MAAAKAALDHSERLKTVEPLQEKLTLIRRLRTWQKAKAPADSGVDGLTAPRGQIAGWELLLVN